MEQRKAQQRGNKVPNELSVYTEMGALAQGDTESESESWARVAGQSGN